MDKEGKLTQQDVIDIIIEAFESKNLSKFSHKYQNGKNVQIHMKDKTFFNIAAVQVYRGKNFIAVKHRPLVRSPWLTEALRLKDEARRKAEAEAEDRQ